MKKLDISFLILIIHAVNCFYITQNFNSLKSSRDLRYIDYSYRIIPNYDIYPKPTFALNAQNSPDTTKNQNQTKPGVVKRILSFFWTDSNSNSNSNSDSTQKEKRKDEIEVLNKPNEPYKPKGILGVVKINMKRYLFNLLDRSSSSSSWAKAVSVDGRDGSGIYISRRAYYNQARNMTQMVQFQRQQRLKSKKKGVMNKVKLFASNIKSRIFNKPQENDISSNNNNIYINYEINGEENNIVYDPRYYEDYSDDELTLFSSVATDRRILTPSSIDIDTRPKLQFPSITLPTLPSLPQFQLPSLPQLPSVSLPSLSSISLPSLPSLPTENPVLHVLGSVPKRVNDVKQKTMNFLFEKIESDVSVSSSISQTSNKVSTNTSGKTENNFYYSLHDNDYYDDNYNNIAVVADRLINHSDRRYNAIDTRRKQEMALSAKSSSSLSTTASDHFSTDRVGSNTNTNNAGNENKNPPLNSAPNTNNPTLLDSAADTMKGMFGSAVSAVNSIRTPTIPDIPIPPIPSMPSMPWDVYYRGAIPFFENALKSADSVDEAKDNLVAQIMASDEVDASANHHIIERPKESEIEIQIPLVEINKNKESIQISIPEIKSAASKLLGGMFPLISKVVKKTFKRHDDSSSTTILKPIISSSSSSSNSIDDISTIQLSDTIDVTIPISPDHSYARGSVQPGDGIGLGLGLDPDYVKAMRIAEEESKYYTTTGTTTTTASSSTGTTTGTSISLGNGEDMSHIFAEENIDKLVTQKKQSILRRIYNRTARPIIMAPIHVFKWTKNKIFRTQISSNITPTAAPFDEEIEGLQQEIRQAVRDKEVLPASILDNTVLEQYDAAKSAPSLPMPIQKNIEKLVAAGIVSEISEVTPLKGSKSVNGKTVVESVSPAILKASTTTPPLTLLSTTDNISLKKAMIESSSTTTTTATLPSTISSLAASASTGSSSNSNSMNQASISNALLLDPLPSSPAMSQMTLDTSYDMKTTTTTTSMTATTSKELRMKPQFVDKERIPIPTKADFAFLETRRISRAVTAALAITSEKDAKEFLKDIGLSVLLTALEIFHNNDNKDARVETVKGICRLMRMEHSIVDIVANSTITMNILMDMMDSPMKGFRSFRMSAIDKLKADRYQREALALVLRMVRTSEIVPEILKYNKRLKNILNQIVAQGEVIRVPDPIVRGGGHRANTTQSILPPSEPVSSSFFSYMPFFSSSTAAPRPEKKFLNGKTVIVDYPELKTYQMARVAANALGATTWKPKQPGQKGLRILSLDGGGTKGVLSIALIKELMTRIGYDKPHEVFDIICGTSTGGIIACLLGIQMRSIQETEYLYDDLISRVFSKKSNLKLVSEQALYDEIEFEKILHDLLGEEILVDSHRNNCAKVFFASTKVNNNPPLIQLWRNYNYPPDQSSRYPGTYRMNTLTAVRATTAAPTFFTPISWQGGLYCDGALVANNPTAIALQEAKMLYPGVPIELVVSLGTGYYTEGNNVKNMGWDLLVNHIIATSVDTEDVHSLLADFLPADKYFRFNPPLQANLPIDELNKTVLTDMKRIAKEAFKNLEKVDSPESKRVEQMIKTLRGSNK